MRRTAVCISIPLLLLGSACAPRVRDVVVMVGSHSVTVNAPPFIGVGDSLRVRVQDSAYVNRYVARDTAVTLTAMDATAMWGDTTLKVMSLAFAPSQVRSGASPVAPAAVVRQANSPREAATFMETPGGRRRPRTAAERGYAALLDSIVAENALLHAEADTMGTTLEALRGRIRADRAEHARVTLLHDTTWLEAAGRMADDPSLRAASTVLVSLTAANPSTIGLNELYDYRRHFEQYGRRLDIFRALLPVEPPPALNDTSSVPTQMVALARLSSVYEQVLARRAVLEARALILARQIENEPPIPPAPARPALLVLGMNLDHLLASPARLQQTVDATRERLDAVNRGTVRVVTAANQLPRWTVTGDTATILTSVYPTENEVKVVVTRRNRFAPWGTGATTAAAAAAKPATTTTTSGGTTVTTVTTVTQGGTEKKEEAGGSSGGAAAASMPLVVVPRTDDTVAVLSIPVLQRYRFRLGVGMAFSQLETTALETLPGAVDGDSGVFVLHKGTNEHRFIPVALLSYTFLPLEGRYLDGRARRYPWSNPSLSAQAGVSLQNPTEQLYLGVGVEPFPGLEIGAGRHWAYVETTNQPDGAFVRRSEGSATSKQWLDDWAISFTLDATTFVRAFGGLLGL
jgi:hypothetical protein